MNNFPDGLLAFLKDLPVKTKTNRTAGLFIHFNNGIVVSVQWHPDFNYCNAVPRDDIYDGYMYESETAEVALWRSDDNVWLNSNLAEVEEGSCTYGWQSLEDVVKIIKRVLQAK